MRVSLAPTFLRAAATPGAPLLTPEARVILGGAADEFGLPKPVAPGAATLFGPRGVCFCGPGGPLAICDTGHHRLLIWNEIPRTDHAPADFIIGQSDFSREGRNGKGAIGPATLNVPTGLCFGDGVFAVADPWNHRVLLWRGVPQVSNSPADAVLGQEDFHGGLANRGGAVGPDTLNWCYGVTIDNGRLIVADTGNRRVLIWNEIPRENGAAADLVLGQSDFVTRDENAGLGGGPLGMRWPHAVACVGGALFIADAGDNRVMVWREWPREHGAGCDFVLGQNDIASLDHNRSAYYPNAGAMNMPYGLCVAGERLIVADTANSRLLGFDLDGLGQGVGAARLAGQRDFERKGDNRWGDPARDSLCWPYGVAASDGWAAVADSGNNRVLLWEFAP
jgi:hypothetical protein